MVDPIDVDLTYAGPSTRRRYVPDVDTADWYRYFAEVEAAASSPSYRVLADGVADDDVVLERLGRLPAAKRQPNLLFATVRFLGGPTADWEAFRSFVLDSWDRVAGSVSTRSTQTNEAARCAALLPILGTVRSPIALIDVGASAGLCLFPDRYSYSYNDAVIGNSPVHIEVECSGPVPIPSALPEVCWRRGIDVNPLDVRDSDDVAWLRSCIWPEHDERRDRLDRAAKIVADDPPIIVRGDLNEEIDAVISAAPNDATTVVFHSAVMSYLSLEQRRVFAANMSARPGVVWISNEGPGVIEGLSAPPKSRPNGFELRINGGETLAHTDPHGRWLAWLSSA